MLLLATHCTCFCICRRFLDPPPIPPLPVLHLSPRPPNSPHELARVFATELRDFFFRCRADPNEKITFLCSSCSYRCFWLLDGLRLLFADTSGELAAASAFARFITSPRRSRPIFSAFTGHELLPTPPCLSHA